MNEQRNWLEWGVLALCTLAVAGVFGYLLYEAYQSSGTRRGKALPILVVAAGQIVPAQGGQFQVRVVVHNTGRATAEQAGIEVLLEGAPEKESVEFEVQRLARDARVEVYVIFSQDPREPGRKLLGRVTHFRLP